MNQGCLNRHEQKKNSFVLIVIANEIHNHATLVVIIVTARSSLQTKKKKDKIHNNTFLVFRYPNIIEKQKKNNEK